MVFKYANVDHFAPNRSDTKPNETRDLRGSSQVLVQILQEDYRSDLPSIQIPRDASWGM